MDRLIHSAASGLSASMNRMRVIANNLANSQTTGFRADVLGYQPMTLDGPGLEVRAMNNSFVTGAMMDAGTVSPTGRDLDIALDGDALMAVQTREGGEGYTRRGDLSVSPSGVLQNGEGLPVMGLAGPITVPTDAKVTINRDGAVMIAQDGQPPVEAARIKLASPRGSSVVKGIDNVLRVPGGGVLPADDSATLKTGALEGSNVDSTSALVDMVEAQRLYDMRAKLVSTARDLDEGGASLMRLNT